jgi:hypothetical protein
VTASDLIRAVLAGLAIAMVFAAVFLAVRPVPPPVFVFTPTAFCPSGQHLANALSGTTVCAAPVKQSHFDFQPRRAS